MSKRKEEKREQEYYRKKIGEKLEEAYLSIPMGEPPSEETIKKWIQIADQKRAKRLKRKRILLSSAAAVVLCVGVCATCILHTPEAVAGNSGEVKIEEGMDSKDIYLSNNDVPQHIRDLFYFFPEEIEGFNIKEIVVTQTSNMQKMEIIYSDKEDNEIFIEQTKVDEDDYLASILSENTTMETWDGQNVYINSYSTGEQTISYKLIKNDIFIKISTGPEFDKNDVKMIIQKAARY